MSPTDTLLIKFETLIRSKESKQEEILNCLKQINNCKKIEGDNLIGFFNSLLFLMAYPYNQEVFDAASQSFFNLENSRVKHIQQSKALYHTKGIPASVIEARFTFTIVSWFLKQFPENIESIGSEAKGDTWQEIINLLLPIIISEEFENAFTNKEDWLKGKSPKEELNYILSIVNNAKLSTKLKEHFFFKLNQFVSIQLPESKHWLLPEKSGMQTKPFYHKQIEKFNPKNLSLIHVPLNEINLTTSNRLELERRAKVTLLSLQRETDPITYSQTEELRYFNLGRGFTLALFQLKKDFQLGIDVYIGYMAFKNDIPAAYGGAWLFDERAKLGINIFPYMRGGESNFLFAQLMSTYQALGNLSEFTVEPYQIGKDNEDGVKSGAFWFYYKFGFRPQQKVLKELAAKEFEKIKCNPNYRSSQKTLKQLAESNLLLRIKKPDSIQFDSAILNHKITKLVNQNFNGNSSLAHQFILKTLKIPLKTNDACGQFLLLLPLVMQQNLSETNRNKALEFFNILKNGKDLTYHYYLQNFMELKTAFINLQVK